MKVTIFLMLMGLVPLMAGCPYDSARVQSGSSGPPPERDEGEEAGGYSPGG